MMLKTKIFPKILILNLVTAFLITGCAGTKIMQEKKSDKEIAQLYTELGTSALLRADYSQAVSDLKKAMSLNSKDPVTYNHLGLAYLSLQNPKLAEESFKTAIDIDPNYSDAHINLGVMAANAGDKVKARKFYEKALANLEYRYRHRALTNLAQIELMDNNVDKARQLLYQSTQANPDYCLSHFLLGSLYMRDNNAAKAAESFKKSVAKTCVGNPEGHFQLGIAYMKSRKYDAAKKQFVFLIEEFPQTLQAKKAGDELKSIP